MVLWQYYRQGYAYGMNQRMAKNISQPPPPTTAQTEREPKPKMAPPKIFKGDRTEFSNFLIQLSLIFRIDPTRYHNDTAKIAYAPSYLDGSAKEWFRPHVNLTTGDTPAFPTWASFIQALKAAFDDPDAYQTAERKIHNLRQGNRDCATYHAEFFTCATILDWDERTKISFFKKGLDDELQKLLLTNFNPPTVFTDYVAIAIKLDNNLRAHKQQKYTTPRTNDGRFTQTTPTMATGSHSGPMDLSATRRTQTNTNQNQLRPACQKRGLLSDAEKKRCRDNNLYSYCGSPGHWAFACPSKRNRGTQRAAAAEVETTEVLLANATVEETLYQTNESKND